MGIYGALATAVSGLKAQSFALEHVSGNIANSQTVGFKRTETTFADLVPDSPYYKQLAGGVQVFTRATNNVQGDIRAAEVPTFMGINGDGFFIVEQRADMADGNPVFGGVDYYTRRGDFEFDRSGYLVNGAGNYLKAIRVDPQTGNLVGSLPEPVRITNDFLPAQATSQIDLRANLSSYPMTTAADPDIPDSELLNPADYNNNPTAGADGLIQGQDVSTFLDQSISGSAITVYDSAGAPVNIQMRWAKTDNTNGGGSDTWNLFYQVDSNATGTDTAWLNVGQDYVFNSSGQLTPDIAQVNLTGVTVNGVNVGDITLKHGVNGITQFADSNGNAQVTELRQNGYAAGELVGVSISEAGRIVASYTNGRTVDLYEVRLASFNAENRLQKMDGGTYAVTQDSGPAILGAQGSIIGASVESSNTDIADEFTKLIVTQQAYAAGTRIVTTSNEMLQEVLNMIR
ncbi:flagellar hook protein FlgE [Microbaculum marinisediminis]|uniref:Flagellar hook protein FlgE n=1 Tax=Microbaculum marinisediminis TaxID=2931392 RepID=A0AAW5R278_9HYPH|nr:flagellar hook protein FlgE [Microbaculum sp. A6E488]MCT8972811.1 flagellar hook protein FlgE [Microbaculum sp. A6E488]